MSNRNELDREIAAYLEARSAHRAPDGLRDAALAGVERTRQRPAWSVAGWWLRDRRLVPAPAPRLIVLACLVMLIVLSVALAFVVGSSIHRLPPPFGLARPGLVALDLGGQIFVANGDGSGRRPLTPGTDTATNPVWSPDGTLIAYESRGADLNWAVVVIGADGGHPILLADGISQMGGISWSPDSRRVAYGARFYNAATGEDPYDWSLYIADADRPGASRLGTVDVFGLAPSWSPDGKDIAFKRVYRSSGTPDDVALWVIGADGRNARRLSSEKELYNSAGGDDAFRNTAWAPDGKRLAYLADGVLPPTHNNAGLAAAYDVYVVNADGTDEVNITNSPDEEYWPSWSPDGSRVAFARMSAVRPRMGFDSRSNDDPESHLGTLVVANPDTGSLVPLKGPLVDSASPVWSPDGTSLLAYVFDPSLINERAIAVFDPLGLLPTVTIAAEHFNGASWQRLAP